MFHLKNQALHVYCQNLTYDTHMVKVGLCDIVNSNNTLCLCSHAFLQSILNTLYLELKMNQEVLANFGTAVHELFIRWDALKLAVEHMGGRTGQQVKRNVHTNALLEKLQLNFANYFAQYHSDCQRNQRLCFQLLYTK